MSILRDLFTGADGVSHDLGRWSWAGSWAAVVGLAGWHAYHGTAPSIGDLAQSLSVVAAAHGAALFAKQQTEPKG